jgi:hypothetical protein
VDKPFRADAGRKEETMTFTYDGNSVVYYADNNDPMSGVRTLFEQAGVPVAMTPAPVIPEGVRAKKRYAAWRQDLTRAWGYWRSKAKNEHEGARIDEAFERELAEGPDFLRCHGNAEFCDAPQITLDRNDIAKLMTTWRAIERGTWNDRAKGKHGGAIGRMAMRLLEAFLFVLYRPGKALCVPYEAIGRAAMVSRRTVAEALKHLAMLGLITVIPRRKRIRTELGFKVVQDVNAYTLHPPRGLGALAMGLFVREKDQSAKPALLKGPEDKILSNSPRQTLEPPDTRAENAQIRLREHLATRNL